METFLFILKVVGAFIGVLSVLCIGLYVYTILTNKTIDRL